MSQPGEPGASATGGGLRSLTLPARPAPNHPLPAGPARRDFAARVLGHGRLGPLEQVLADEEAVAVVQAGLLLEALGGLDPAAAALLGGELPAQDALLAEGADRLPQGRLQDLGLLGQEHLAVVGVPDVAAEADQVLLV